MIGFEYVSDIRGPLIHISHSRLVCDVLSKMMHSTLDTISYKA